MHAKEHIFDSLEIHRAKLILKKIEREERASE